MRSKSTHTLTLGRRDFIAASCLGLLACRASPPHEAAVGDGGAAGRAGQHAAGAAGDKAGAAGAKAGAGGSRELRDAGRLDAAAPADAQPPVVRDAGAPDLDADGGDADSTWSDLTVMAVVNPKDHGAVGDGMTDDLASLGASVDALPAAGGIVYFPEGATFKKTNLWNIAKPHVKLWAPNRQAEIFQSVAGQRRHQSIICRTVQGCGFFGLLLRSDASARFDALEDNQISIDHGSLVEVVGCEVSGSAATGVFMFGSREHYIEGNYIHHTWADHIHHTEGAQQSWVWDNFIFNEAPSKGDDGVACVTYKPESTRCSDMEWWHNTILHTDWGRGYSVIGGNDIHIHHNWAIGVAGAGIIVASESSYNSASSDGITIENNNVYQCAHNVGHPGILISGENSAAAPLANITLRDNVSAETGNGSAYRAEGAYTNVTNTGLLSTSDALPKPIPTRDAIQIADTRVLRTRDLSHVAATYRPGLYRIHVRRAPQSNRFQQRFEYVVQGSPDAIAAFSAARTSAGDYVSEQRKVGAIGYALVLAKTPLTIAPNLTGVSFRALRAADQSGELAWLWKRVNTGAY